MFKISYRCSVGGAAVVYRELANLLREMHTYYDQPQHQLTYSRQVAWCYFERLMALEVATWLYDHQTEPPVVDLYLSGLSVSELAQLEQSLNKGQAADLAKCLYWGLMSICHKLRQDFKTQPQAVTPDMRFARRQLRDWCTQAGREYRQLRNRALFGQVSLSATGQKKSGHSCYMASSGAW